ncbi:DUF7619 domain-containing protein [Niastella vici]|nr:T9SS type A sorting domain-containing protein [Niastella vici]
MKWQKIFGGTATVAEYIGPGKTSLIDRDGGYLVATTRIGSGGYGEVDFKVYKLDTSRNIKWSVLLGGSASDKLGTLQLAHDSGYILTGYTKSNDINVSGNHGGEDAWVVRLNDKGNIIWQKCYGGTSDETGTYIEKTSDGYILLGEAKSNDGDVSGVHQGSRDIWVVKLDKNGNIQWQKCLGGSGVEFPTALKQTPDSGFIITGTTKSNDGDVQGLHGTVEDIWVVKIDRTGNIEWQKCLGGTNYEYANDINISLNGGYIVVGLTASTNGDVTGYHPTAPDEQYQTNDAWVVSLSKTGQLQWQRTYGGDRDEMFRGIQVLPDHTYLAVGHTRSSNGDVSFSSGDNDCWLVKLDTSGQIIWEKTYVSSGPYPIENGVCSAVRPNGNIVIGGNNTNGGNSAAWLFEVGSSNTIAGYAFYDANSDGIKNNGESFFDKVTIKSGKNGDTTSAIPRNGYYTMDVDTGTYSTKAVPYNNYYTISPAAKTSTFNSYFNTDSIYFAVQPLPGIRDVTVSLLPLTPARPGFAVQYKLVYKNVGTNSVGAGTIKLTKDTRLSLSSTVPAATSVNGNLITWDYSNLAPNAEASITLNFVLGTAPSVNLGDTIKSVAIIESDAIDVTPIDDTSTLKQRVIGSFDPNDKTEANAGVITPAQVSNGEYLNYLIRFQNTGTDTAFNVTVRDTLESRLDWNSLQMIAASHDYQLSIEDGNKLTWQFNNIKLPYTEPDSHGYIAYRIKPKSTVLAGDIIKNTAGIYFDYNLPVATNTQQTLVFLFSPLPVTLLSFQAALDGAVVNVSWTTSQEDKLKRYEVQRSTNGIDFTTIGTVQPGKTAYLFKDKQPVAGYNYYRLRSVDIDGSQSFSTMVLVNVKNGADIISSLYPNPATGHATLKLQGSVDGNVLVQVLDQQGRLITTRQFGVQHTNEFKMPLDLGSLSKGSYVLRITVDDKTYLHKLLIQ